MTMICIDPDTAFSIRTPPASIKSGLNERVMKKSITKVDSQILINYLPIPGKYRCPGSGGSQRKIMHFPMAEHGRQKILLGKKV